jgi:hypothetical protein
MSEAVRLYGTNIPAVMSIILTVGGLSFTLEEGALRHIFFDGVEFIRGIAFLVRDRDWGTLTPALSIVSRKSGGVPFPSISRQSLRPETLGSMSQFSLRLGLTR